MKFHSKLVFLSFFLLSFCASAIEPYTIRCPYNGTKFLKKHIVPKLIKPPYKKVPWSAQVLRWRVGNNNNSFDLAGCKKQYKVRVLLGQCSDKDHCVLEADEGFLIALYNNKRIINTQKLHIKARANQLFFNHIKIKGVQYIMPVAGCIKFNDNIYKGKFYIVPDNNKILVINELAIEDYVCSVLRSESWPGWPLEVNKAFAIASRSYAIAKVREHAKSKNKKLYHFKNTNIHQTYNGHHYNATLLQAVHETEGVILAHEQKPVLAMFDSCCGGIIPAHLHDVDFTKVPYLQRPQQCTFCKSCKIYQWKMELGVQELRAMLHKAGYRIGPIRDICVSATDKAGAVQEILVKDRAAKIVKISGKQFYSLSKDIKSYCYKITKNNETIIIQGRGYGHHLGLCQWGARAMIDHGYDHRQILQFYYPKTHFMKIALNAI